jgi:tetratricopeptide (TPR) repeat protein
MDRTKINNLALIPINESFVDVFETFMDDNQKTKIRANSVRQYAEGIIDLLLKDKIVAVLKPNENYTGINWGRKITIIKESYDRNIGENIQEIFRIGGDGSHFNGQVNDDDLHIIINKAIHIVEDIFVNYFLAPEHRFGCEDIYTIFSMLPLHHRIYILEKVSTHYTNPYIVDRLSLAYTKSGDKNKAITLLEKSLQENVIDEFFYQCQLIKINTVYSNLAELYERNAQYENDPERSVALIDGNQLVVGLPTSKDVFDTARAVQIFSKWFETDKDKYPEFINLFLYLMKTDNRQYN